MKKNIAIIMGGYSSEVDISLKSGALVYKNISKEKYNTYCVHILKDKWVAVIDGEEYPINKHDFSALLISEKPRKSYILLKSEAAKAVVQIKVNL